MRGVVKFQNGEGAFLVLRAVLDPLENHGFLAFRYEPYAVCVTESFAKQFCSSGRILTNQDCWAISHPSPEFKYCPVPSLSSIYEAMLELER